MPVHRYNPYFVKSASGRHEKTAEECFAELQKDTAHYSKFLDRAAMDKTTGLYTCYFMRDEYLMSGTTQVEPKHHVMSLVRASEYGIVDSKPGLCEIYPQNPFVLWRIRSESQ